MNMYQALAITLNLHRVWIALGHLASVFSISTVSQQWYGLSTTAVGPGTSTDIEGIISVGANMSTVAAKRAYLDAKSSNQTDSKEPPSIAASTRTDPEKARIVRTVTGTNIQETTSLQATMAFSEPQSGSLYPKRSRLTLIETSSSDLALIFRKSQSQDYGNHI